VFDPPHQRAGARHEPRAGSCRVREQRRRDDLVRRFQLVATIGSEKQRLAASLEPSARTSMRSLLGVLTREQCAIERELLHAIERERVCRDRTGGATGTRHAQ